MTPALVPADPIPEMALPIISAVDEGAAPERADPILNSRIWIMNIHFGE